MNLRGWVLRLIGRRAANRVLVGVLTGLVIVAVAGGFYDNARVNQEQARTDAILQGKINIATAEINANGQTLAQAERELSVVLRTDRADIDALKAEVAALQAQDAQLEQQIAALQTALGSQPSGSGPAPTPRPPSKPTPTPRPNRQAPVVCVSLVCLGPHAASCPHGSPHNPHC